MNNRTLQKTIEQPKFCKEQPVSFLGGWGIIKNSFLSAGKWLYLVEMELGPEPEMGRIGPETTILLYQTDLQEVMS